MLADGWIQTSLTECVERAVGGGTPSRSIPGFWEGAIPWASVKDFSDERIDLWDTAEHISEAALAASAANIIEPGIPIVCTRMAVGRCAIARCEVAINQDLKALLPKSDIAARYLVYVLKRLQPSVEAKAIGSTVKGIAVRDLLALSFARPPLSEQHRIVEILDTVDEATRKTEQIVTKLQQMKRGLLHDLFTRGIDDNGELRDTSQHPEQFSDSPVGRSPLQWEWRPLSAVASVQTGPFGSQLHAADYVESGTPIVTVEHLSDNEILRKDLPLVSDLDSKRLARYSLRPGDIVFSRVGAIDRRALVSSAESGWLFSGRLLRVRLLGETVSGRFLSFWFAHPRCVSWIRRNAVGSTMATLNTKILESVPTPVPPRDEQDRIADRLAELAQRITGESALTLKLKLLKRGLLDDLLTGRVRAPILEEASA